MDEKWAFDRKLEEQRKLIKQRKEDEIKEIEESRKWIGTNNQIYEYVGRVQRDIIERKYKAEK